MIELQGIGKTYRRPGGEPVRALDDVSLRIERGDFVAIVGTSGSGKSTLMNVLGLLDRPDTGRYLLDSEDVAGLDVNRQARVRNKRIGFVFQAFHLLPRTTALENVELPLLYSDRDDIAGLGRRALEQVGLADRIDHKPSELAAASSSAWRSPVLWSTSRTCCWPTSRPATSTQVRRARCCRCSRS